MWKVDPEHGLSFRDSTNRDQQVLFEFEADLSPLLGLLRARFGVEPFTIEQAADFVLLDTPFRDDGHLKRPTLAPAERSGVICAEVPGGAKRRAGTYPPRTVLRFSDGH
jgi:hypothetical protein